MLTLQSQQDKATALNLMYNSCECLPLMPDYERSVAVEVDFEAAFEPLPADCQRRVYFVTECICCNRDLLYVLGFPSEDIGIQLLVEAIKRCINYLSDEIEWKHGIIDEKRLGQIRREIRAAWLMHNPDPWD